MAVYVKEEKGSAAYKTGMHNEDSVRSAGGRCTCSRTDSPNATSPSPAQLCRLRALPELPGAGEGDEAPTSEFDSSDRLLRFFPCPALVVAAAALFVVLFAPGGAFAGPPGFVAPSVLFWVSVFLKTFLAFSQ